MSKAKPPKGGRTRGSGSGQLVDRLRIAVDRAIGELDRRGKPLHLHIADAMERDPAKTIQAIRGLLPQEVRHEVESIHTLHLDAVRALSRPATVAIPHTVEQPMPITLDAEIIEAEVTAGEGRAQDPDEDEDERTD